MNKIGGESGEKDKEHDTQFDMDDLDDDLFEDYIEGEEQDQYDDEFMYPAKNDADDKLQSSVKKLHLTLIDYEHNFSKLRNDLSVATYEKLCAEYLKYCEQNINKNNDLLNMPLIKSDLSVIDEIIAFIELHLQVLKEKEFRELKSSTNRLLIRNTPPNVTLSEEESVLKQVALMEEMDGECKRIVKEAEVKSIIVTSATEDIKDCI